MLAVGAGAATQPESPLTAITCSSSDGRYVLTVEPGASDGSGPAHYLFLEDDITRWEGTRPYTLQGVHVTATGQVAGYSYSAGRAGGPGENLLELWLLDAGGSAIYHRQFARQPDVLDAPPYPACAGVVVDERQQRVAYRVTPPQLASQMFNTWPQVDLATGRELPPLRLAYAAMGLPDQVTLDAVHVLDGPAALLLVFSRWELVNSAGPAATHSVKTGSYFLLVDWNLRPVWRDENPDDLDYRRLGVTRESAARAGQSENLCRVMADARSFSVSHPAGDETVHYQLDAAGLPRETGRELFPWRATAAAQIPAPPLPPAPAPVSLPAPVPVPPAAAHPSPAPFADKLSGEFMAFAFTEEGRIGLLALDAGQCAFILADSAGQVISRMPLPGDGGHAALACLGDDFWASLVRGADGSTRFRLIAGELQVVREIPLAAPGAQRLAATPDGGFVVLSSAAGAALRKFDRDGRQIWEYKVNYPEPGGLLDPVDIAVDSAGTIIVLDLAREVIQYFSSAGAYLRAVDLEAAVGSRPDYPTRLAVDGQGSVFVLESAGDRRIYRFAPSGRWTGEFRARDQAGLAIDGISDLVVDRDDRLWISDKIAIRLDARGLADKYIGQSSVAPPTQPFP